MTLVIPTTTSVHTARGPISGIGTASRHAVDRQLGQSLEGRTGAGVHLRLEEAEGAAAGFPFGGVDVRLFGSFDAYLWAFVDGRPLRNSWADPKEVPASTPLSTFAGDAPKM